MKIGFWVGYINNLVLKLRKTAGEKKKVIIQVVLTALVLVVAYLILTYFFPSQFFHNLIIDLVYSLILMALDGLVTQNPLNGKSVLNRLPGFVFVVLLMLAVITVWSRKISFRLSILVIATPLGLISTPFLVEIIERLLVVIDGAVCVNELPKDERSKIELCREQSVADIQNNLPLNNLPLLVMSLPVLLVLWIFRTYDTHQQIEKTQKQVEASVSARRTSTYDNLLSTGLQLLASDNVLARCIGLVQLALVRRESPELKEQIDASTQNLTLYQEGKSKSESIKLSGAMLQNMKLKEAIMKGANLLKADMEGANLEGADLAGAILIGANLKGANLEGANLQGARLEGADLEGAILVAANLMQAQLLGAKLTRANLERAIMIDANLMQTPLQKTDLKGANLKGACLSGAMLGGTILVDSDLTKSDLPLELSLTWFDDEKKESLRVSDPGGADLGVINAFYLDTIDFTGVKYDTHTKLPQDPEFDPDERGLIKVD